MLSWFQFSFTFRFAFPCLVVINPFCCFVALIVPSSEPLTLPNLHSKFLTANLHSGGTHELRRDDEEV